jgi:hypothetical protein
MTVVEYEVMLSLTANFTVIFFDDEYNVLKSLIARQKAVIFCTPDGFTCPVEDVRGNTPPILNVEA